MCVLPAADADACVPSFVLVLMLDDDTDVLPFGALLDSRDARTHRRLRRARVTLRVDRDVDARRGRVRRDGHLTAGAGRRHRARAARRRCRRPKRRRRPTRWSRRRPRPARDAGRARALDRAWAPNRSGAVSAAGASSSADSAGAASATAAASTPAPAMKRARPRKRPGRPGSRSMFPPMTSTPAGEERHSPDAAPARDCRYVPGLFHRRPLRRDLRGPRSDFCNRCRHRRSRARADRLLARRRRGAGRARGHDDAGVDNRPTRLRRRPSRGRGDARTAAERRRPVRSGRAAARHPCDRQPGRFDPLLLRPHGVRHARGLGDRPRPHGARPGRARQPRGVAARRHGARHRRGAAPGVRVRGPGRDVERRRAVLPQPRCAASRRRAPRRRRRSRRPMPTRSSRCSCATSTRRLPIRATRSARERYALGSPRVQRHRARLRGDLPVGMGGAVPDRGRDATRRRAHPPRRAAPAT